MKLRRTILLATALALASCGGGIHLDARDLAAVMPSASEAPPGTEIDTERVGPMTLDEFVTDATVKARLRELGFRSAYVVSFSTPNFVADAQETPLGSAQFVALGLVLEDASSAEQGFDFYVDRLRGRAKGLTQLLVDGPGDEVFSFRFSSLDDTPLPGVASMWRTGNALLSIVAIGNPSPDPQLLREMANAMTERARAA